MAVNKVRRNGSYAPLSAHYYKDDAVDEAGEAAELLYVRGLAFCADVLSDGFISERQLVRFVGVGMFDATDRADRLVKVGLWERVAGGYQVRSWLDWNRSRSEITDALAKDSARKGRSGRVSDSERPEPDPPNGGGQPDDRIPDGIRAESEPASDGTPEGFQPRARTPLHSTPLQEKTSATADAATRRRAGFDEFWSLYPRKVKKQDARKAWDAVVVRGKIEPDIVLTALRAQIGRWQAERKEIQFIPHPPTWLRGARWADEPETLLTLVPDQRRPGDPEAAYTDLLDRADAVAASRLLGTAYLPRPQPRADPSPARTWERDQARAFIAAHHAELLAHLSGRERSA